MNIAGNSTLTTNLSRLDLSSGQGQGNVVSTGRSNSSTSTSTTPPGFNVDGTSTRTGTTTDTNATTSTGSTNSSNNVAESIQASDDYRQLAADLRAGKITAAEKEEVKLRQDIAVTSPDSGSFKAAVAAFTANSGSASTSSLSVTV